MPLILTLTLNPTVDVSAHVPAVVPEAKLRLEGVRHEPGGGGINVARAIHQLGGETHAIFPAGGGWGERLVELLAAEEVAATPLPVGGATRESLTLSETSSDRQFRFVMPGPSLAEAEWQAALEAVRGHRPAPEILVFSGSLPPGVPEDFAARVVAVGRELGCRVLVDTSRAALRHVVATDAYLLKPNLAEFLALTGETTHTDESLVVSARRLLEGGVAHALAISLGTAGVLLVTADVALRFAAPVVPIRSRVGAGDSMVAGMALALARGESLDVATQFGVAAGAAAVMTPGSELCRREDAEALFAEIREQPAAVVGRRTA
jgi:6-phosphofructokinase 2